MSPLRDKSIKNTTPSASKTGRSSPSILTLAISEPHERPRMQRLIVIDACCTLNLLATRREDEILAGANLALVMSARAHSEAMFLSTPPDETGLRARESASTERLLSSGRLSIRAL